jgi:outer membrane receptor for Fe3+-dicitrate
MVTDRKGILALGVSLIAMSVTAPAWAQSTATSNSTPTTEGKAASSDIAGGVGPAQERGGSDGGEIVVTGLRASIQASLDQKRRSVMVSEVITAQDIGKFPDKNVAESLQRVPGVTIQREFGEGERISIRGTAPTLNRTLLNGHAVATAPDPDREALLPRDSQRERDLGGVERLDDDCRAAIDERVERPACLVVAL